MFHRLSILFAGSIAGIEHGGVPYDPTVPDPLLILHPNSQDLYSPVCDENAGFFSPAASLISSICILISNQDDIGKRYFWGGLVGLQETLDAKGVGKFPICNITRCPRNSATDSKGSRTNEEYDESDSFGVIPWGHGLIQQGYRSFRECLQLRCLCMGPHEIHFTGKESPFIESSTTHPRIWSYALLIRSSRGANFIFYRWHGRLRVPRLTALAM